MASSNVTQLLQRWCGGDSEVLDQLMPLVHGELRKLARHHMRGERPERTLQATALVNEAFLRLVNRPTDIDWHSRVHFFGIASRLMRQVLVEAARARNAAKRGGGMEKVSLELVFDAASAERPIDLLALDEALEELAVAAPERCRVVELRYFAGLTIEETAEVLGVSTATVKRQWAVARAWLQQRLSEGDA
jgi:RNA polymerase sigma factor (TIGR02999 family)